LLIFKLALPGDKTHFSTRHAT